MQNSLVDYQFLNSLNHNSSSSELFSFLSEISRELNENINSAIVNEKKDGLVRSVNLILLRKHENFSPVLLQLLTELYQQSLGQIRRRGNSNIEVNKNLHIIRMLGWPMVFEDIFVEFIVSVIDDRVSEVCKGNYAETFYAELSGWVHEVLSGFIADIYASANDSNSKVNLLLTTIKSKVIYKSISKLRATELFDMIADYPDSLPALKELREAIVASDSIGDVGQIVRAIVKKRLLHVGASTSQILDMYILMIKALRVVDSTDLLLNFVSRPVRQYLLGRKDTVRCITISLTDNPDSNLHDELRKGGAVFVGNVLDDEDDAPTENWMPRKRNPLLVDTSKSRSNDILAALVSIYGSADIFVQEYRILLAEKLLSNTNYNIDQELATVELLKIRFGEEAMHNCEVMLHDIENSKRVNNSVASALKTQKSEMGFPVDFAIVSEHYWPKLLSDDIPIPESLSASINQYTEAYAVIKKPRKISPLTQLGLVELDLAFADGTEKSFTVRPQEAIIINHVATALESKPFVSLQEIAIITELDEADIKSSLMFWMTLHVIREVSSMENDQTCYEIIENQQDYVGSASQTDEQGTLKSMSIQRESSNVVAKLEPYIKGLLSSHGSMSIERIHNMLRLLSSGSSDISFDMNLVQFRSFMQQLVDADHVDLIDGHYRLHGK